MFQVAYSEPRIVPDAYPCCTCTQHGPYCADHCARLDAWEARQAETNVQPRPAGQEPEHGGR